MEALDQKTADPWAGPRTARVTLRVNGGLLDYLTTLAAEQRRTVSDFMHMALEKAANDARMPKTLAEVFGTKEREEAPLPNPTPKKKKR